MSAKRRANPLLTTGDAAILQGLTPDGVRYLVRRGRLHAERTASGQRLYHRLDVETLARTRRTSAAGSAAAL